MKKRFTDLTPHEREIILKAHLKDYQALAKQFGVSKRTFQYWRSILKRTGIKETKTEHIVNEVVKIQELFKELAPVNSEMVFTPEEQHGWIAIGFSGDWHFDGEDADIKALYDAILKIKQMNRFYYIFMGDGGDFFVGRLQHGGFHDTLPPHISRRVFWQFLKETENQLIALISGDHEWFSETVADYNLISDFAERLAKTYLGKGGYIEIKQNDVQYLIHARHRFRMNSSYNLFHACRQFLRFEDNHPDIVAIAHNHKEGIATERMWQEQKVFIRSGTFKVTDNYAQKLGYISKKSAESIPVVLLNLDKKEMRVANSLNEAQDLLEVLNAHATQL